MNWGEEVSPPTFQVGSKKEVKKQRNIEVEKQRREGAEGNMKKALVAMGLVVLAGMGSSVHGQMAVSHVPTATPAAPSAEVATVPPEKPVARVNGTVLTDHDLLREMYTVFPYARQHNGGFPK